MAPILYSVFTNFKKIKLTTWIFGVVAYLAATSPLLIFDIVHNYDNLLMPVRTILGKQEADLSTFSLSNTLSHIQELLSAIGRLWFIKFWTNPQDQIVLESHMDKTPGNILLSLVSVATLVWFYFKNKSDGYKIFFIYLSVIIIAFILYPSYNPEYYLMSFLTLMTIVVGYTFSSLPKKIAIPVVLIFIAVNIVSTVTMSGKYGLSVRQRLVEKTVIALGGRSFHLTTEGELPAKEFAYAGWRYLLRNRGATPHKARSIMCLIGFILMRYKMKSQNFDSSSQIR